MLSMKIKRKLRGLWKSRTAHAGVVLGFLVSIQPSLMSWLGYKLTAENAVLAGMIVTGTIWALRWITERPLEDKGK